MVGNERFASHSSSSNSPKDKIVVKQLCYSVVSEIIKVEISPATQKNLMKIKHLNEP